MFEENTTSKEVAGLYMNLTSQIETGLITAYWFNSFNIFPTFIWEKLNWSQSDVELKFKPAK